VKTKGIAKKIIKETMTKKQAKPLIFIIEGDLGVGKTIFVKGVGEYFGIKDIISPTFVVYYEYNISSKFQVPSSKLVHVDLYNLEREEEFKYLGLEKYLKPGNIFCIEWGEKASAILETLKNKGDVVFIKMKYIDQNKRQITIQN
jgi:tRNA threonylcarbamoyl adenosine modification protein YjeE